jgi:hypothetical protein
MSQYIASIVTEVGRTIYQLHAPELDQDFTGHVRDQHVMLSAYDTVYLSNARNALGLPQDFV